MESYDHPTLSVKRGDTIAEVQEKLWLKSFPHPIVETDKHAFYYHLPDLGFWVFFNEESKVYSIRYEAPYPFSIEGIKIGDHKEKVLEVRGKPNRHMPIPDGKTRWIYDRPRFIRMDFDPETNLIEKIFR